MAQPKECCLSGHLHSGDPQGKMEKVGDFDAYVTGTEKSKTILAIADVFGINTPNVKLLADEYAQAGFYCVVPDFYQGSEISLDLQKSIAPLQSDPEPSLTEKAINTAKVGVSLATFRARNTEASFKPKVQSVLQTLRSDPAIRKIGGVGYCYGARYAMLFSSEGSEPSFDACVGNHPSFVTVPDEIEAISKPIQINVGDVDPMMPKDQQQQVKEILSKKPFPTEVNIIKDAVHGFSVRGDLNNDKEKKDKETATENAIRWFKTHLA